MGIKVQLVGIGYLLLPVGLGIELRSIRLGGQAASLHPLDYIVGSRIEIFISSSFSSSLPFPFFLNEIGSQVAQAGIKLFVAGDDSEVPVLLPLH